MSVATIPVVAAALAALAVACSAGSDQAEERGVDAAAVNGASSAEELLPDEFPLLQSEVSADGLRVIFATPDLAVGENRVGFVLTTTESLVREPAATVSSLYFRDGDSKGEIKQTVLAVFRPWPYGTRGIYTTRLNFDAPGRWGIDITVSSGLGKGRRATMLFDVMDTPYAPAVGSLAVKSDSKTLDDVERISQLATGSLQDPDLYEVSVAEAVASGSPTVVVMASPAFCTNAVCGPQVEVLQQLKEQYEGKANFVHVDFYDNPEEIQGDLTRARVSPTVKEWGLRSTEWSFVIDKRGFVSARFESFATFDELEQALLEVL